MIAFCHVQVSWPPRGMCRMCCLRCWTCCAPFPARCPLAHNLRKHSIAGYFLESGLRNPAQSLHLLRSLHMFDEEIRCALVPVRRVRSVCISSAIYQHERWTPKPPTLEI